MLETNWRGLWWIICDVCGGKFELDGSWSATPSKNNTIAMARSRGWKIGKRGTFCAKHRNTPPNTASTQTGAIAPEGQHSEQSV